jgi:hypothetical protein
MRILMLHDPYAPIKNGAVGGEDNLAELQVNTLRELGHEVHDARSFDSGISRKRNQLLTQGMGKSKDVSKIITNFKPDVIHSHLLEAEILSRAVIKQDVRYFSHFHDNISQLKKNKLWKVITQPMP